jgi:LysM repeat protein
MGTIVGLMVLSGGLFAYENVYVAKQEQANKVTIYVANQDIQAHTAIKADMFQPLEIDNTSVLQGYVLDLNSVVGKELKGGLLIGEPLTQQRLDDKSSNEKGELTLKISPDSVGDIKANDNVRVYVQLINEDSGEITVKELFTNKKVLKDNEGEGSLLTGNQQEPSKDFNVIANENEVKDYYVAKQSGSIIVVKINELDTEKITTDAKTADKFDAKSDEVKNASKDDKSGDEGQAISTYTVKEGDTLESLSLKFKTKKDTISALNGGKEEFEAGEMIQVPAN